jgi:hypothetical protein
MEEEIGGVSLFDDQTQDLWEIGGWGKEVDDRRRLNLRTVEWSAELNGHEGKGATKILRLIVRELVLSEQCHKEELFCC